MRLQELTELVQTDSILNLNNLQQQYSQANINSIISHFDEIHTTYIVDENLTSNFWRYRLSLRRPLNVTDYQPQFLSEHLTLVNFLTSIIAYFYRNDSFLINFSPALLVTDQNLKQRFLYSSTNFFCLGTVIFKLYVLTSHQKKMLNWGLLKPNFPYMKKFFNPAWDICWILWINNYLNCTGIFDSPQPVERGTRKFFHIWESTKYAQKWPKTALLETLKINSSFLKV